MVYTEPMIAGSMFWSEPCTSLNVYDVCAAIVLPQDHVNIDHAAASELNDSRHDVSHAMIPGLSDVGAYRTIECGILSSHMSNCDMSTCARS